LLGYSENPARRSRRLDQASPDLLQQPALELPACSNTISGYFHNAAFPGDLPDHVGLVLAGAKSTAEKVTVFSEVHRSSSASQSENRRDKIP